MAIIVTITLMKKSKKIILTLVLTLALAFTIFNINRFFLNTTNIEDKRRLEMVAYHIQQLKDRHLLCRLDHIYNPKGKDILKDCKKLEIELLDILTYYKGLRVKQ
ncbi:MAG: hypothetical protein U9Q33_07365 [Campylobacterota bacterium]|nr:hypothetical protein [Campylobacterota bacterium]